MKTYGYAEDSTHQAIIYEEDSEAHEDLKLGKMSVGDTKGLLVGSSEWGWIEEDAGRRICAALTYFSEQTTEEIEAMAEERFRAHRLFP